MNKYMGIAKELSEKNLETNEGGPFGACIVQGDEVIGKGSNLVLSSKDPTAPHLFPTPGSGYFRRRAAMSG